MAADPDEGGVGVERPAAFHVMAKPVGPRCNLRCAYCFYRDTERLYPPGTDCQMREEVLERFVRQYLRAQRVPAAHFAWQGGEPTLRGLAFYGRVVELQRRHCPPGMRVHNLLQTNGVLLDDEWGAFLAEHDFLVGLSLDGPAALHDCYRRDPAGEPSFGRVMRGWEAMQRRGVATNILCAVTRANARRPLDVYRFLRGHGADHIQFIPIVVSRAGGPAGDFAVTAEDYGEFLCAVFDEWVARDVGRVFVQAFDVALEAWLGMEPSLCVHAATCGNALALEHDGDLYSCDHYVAPPYRLGNICETPLLRLVSRPRQRQFGRDKRRTLPRECRECAVRFACHGGCPRNRLLGADAGVPGRDALCAGHRRFFTHIDPVMRDMAAALRGGRPRAEAVPARPPAGRNDPCPCGSGRKYKRCCGSST